MIAIFFIYSIKILNFKIFEQPDKEIIKTSCDCKDLREIQLRHVKGNATLSNTVQIVAKPCLSKKNNDELLFTASGLDKHFQKVTFEWESFEKVIIRYPKQLNVFIQKNKTEFQKPIFAIEYITE